MADYNGESSGADLDRLNVTTEGTAEPSKVLTSDADGNIDFQGGIISNVNIAQYQGVTVDMSNDTYERRGSLIGAANSVSPGNNYLPVQRLLRRNILSAAGEVQYYLDPNDSTLKVNGDAANLDGTDGQVMVQKPLFFTRIRFEAGPVFHLDISLHPLDGFFPHKAFFKNGEWVDYRYVGAYEGVAYDNGASAYNDGTGAATNFNGGTIDTANDKLGSVSGFKPVTDETRAEFRAIAGNVGTGWRIEDPYLRHAVNLLMLIEYADFNSQSVIGTGNTSYDGFTYANVVGDTGYSNSDGNGTNASNTAEDGLDHASDVNDGSANTEYMSYRGIENWYGNIWTFLDGLNIKNVESTSKSEAWVANDDTAFADDTETGYEKVTDGLALSEGYQDLLAQINNVMLPTAVGASSSTKITDYYYTYYDNLSAGYGTDWRVARVGGHAYTGSEAGAFTLHTYHTSAFGAATFGARICF